MCNRLLRRTLQSSNSEKVSFAATVYNGEIKLSALGARQSPEDGMYAGAVTQNENPAYIIASSRSFHRLVGQFFRYLTAMLPADCYLTWKLRIKASIMRFHDSKARLHAVYNDGQPDIAAQMWQQHAVEPQIILAGRSKVPWVNINSVQSNHC